MGQFITVTVRPGTSSSVRIFDLNRSLTGMAIERYPSIDDVKDGGDRPPDVLARRLFDLGATAVTVYSSAVAVTAPARGEVPIAETTAFAMALAESVVLYRMPTSPGLRTFAPLMF